MTNYQVYKIRRDYGRLYIRNMHNEYLSAEEIAKVIDELSDLHALMVSDQATQPEIVSRDVEARLRIPDGQFRIEYPFQHEAAVYVRGKSRRASSPRFCGVYFLQMSDRPGVVKIGHTIDLYQRTKQFWHEAKLEAGDSNVQFNVVAFAHSNDGYQTERMFHTFFNHAHVEGEWFSVEVITAWLKGLSA